MVEVGGIEPPSLNNQIKVNYMLSLSFMRNLTRSDRQDPIRRALEILARALKANQPEPACYLLYFTLQAGWIEASSLIKPEDWYAKTDRS